MIFGFEIVRKFGIELLLQRMDVFRAHLYIRRYFASVAHGSQKIWHYGEDLA